MSCCFWSTSIIVITVGGFIGWQTMGQGMSLSEFGTAYPLGSMSATEHTTLLGSNNSGDSACVLFSLLIVIAKSPTIWVSIGYVLWNDQITKIWMEYEWQHFQHKHSIPRLSHDADLWWGFVPLDFCNSHIPSPGSLWPSV